MVAPRSSPAPQLDPTRVLRAPGGLYNTAKSAVRALYILEVLAMAGRPLRAAEIAGQLGLSPSSADQVLKTMVDSAHLIFDSTTKRYFPSPRVARLGSTVADLYFGHGCIDELLRSVFEAVRAQVTLSTAHGGYMQVLAGLPVYRQTLFTRAEGRTYVPEPVAGIRVPLFSSSIGPAWLSAQDDKTLLSTLKLCRRELGKAADDPQPLLARVRDVRERGYAYGEISMDAGNSGVAMALHRCRSDVVLVLGVSGPSPDIEGRLTEIVAVMSDHIGRLRPKAPGPTT